MAVTQERREVAGFDEVRLEGMGVILIEQGESDSLVIEADSDLLPKLKSEVDQGRLILGMKHWYDHLLALDKKTITYHITMREVRGVMISGSGKLRAGPLNTDRLKLNVSGSGDLQVDELHASDLELHISGSGSAEVKGAVAAVEVRISGSGELRAIGLECQTARLQISGSGTVQLNVTQEMKVRISGSGDVSYLGEPHIQQDISGAGRIRRV